MLNVLDLTVRSVIRFVRDTDNGVVLSMIISITK